MNVSKTVNVHLDREDMDMLVDGQPLQIPIDGEQGIVVYPPNDQGKNMSEKEGSEGMPYVDNDGTGVSKSPNGGYEFILERTDGEELTASIRKSQLKALGECIDDITGERKT